MSQKNVQLITQLDDTEFIWDKHVPNDPRLKMSVIQQVRRIKSFPYTSLL